MIVFMTIKIYRISVKIERYISYLNNIGSLPTNKYIIITGIITACFYIHIGATDWG